MAEHNLYREILTVADENGGRLKNRVVFFADELGSCPPIQSLELMFSASRSRGLMLVPIVQSITGQLQKNYGKEGSEIIVDNCQVNIFGGFAPGSQTAETLSEALGKRTVLSGTVTQSKDKPSQTMQMISRPLITPDELKVMPKGSFIVAKTGIHPMQVQLRLFLDWGIRFEKPYEVPEKVQRPVAYVTEGTFDAYLYQLVESKQKFISQIMTSKSPVRSAEDVDEQALSYAEIKALASGNPLIKEKMDLDIEVSKLKLLKANHLSQRYALEDAISKTFPKEIAEQQVRLAGYGADIAVVKENTHPNVDGFSPMVLAGTTYTEKKEAGAELLALCQNMLTPDPIQVGSYRGLPLELAFDTFHQEYRLTMIGQLRHPVTLGTDVFGNLQRKLCRTSR